VLTYFYSYIRINVYTYLRPYMPYAYLHISTPINLHMFTCFYVLIPLHLYFYTLFIYIHRRPHCYTWLHTLRPYLPYTFLHISTPLFDQYMFKYFCAHIFLYDYVHLRLYTPFSCLHFSTPTYVFIYTYAYIRLNVYIHLREYTVLQVYILPTNIHIHVYIILRPYTF